jgi:hypothetical protein
MATGKDPYKGYPDSVFTQGRKLKQVTPSDLADLPDVPKCLFVTASGNLAITAADGNENAAGADLGASIIFAVVAGQIFDLVRVGRVWSTGTTATVLAVI